MLCRLQQWGGYGSIPIIIPFLGGWTSVYQLFWCSPGVQGFDTLPGEDLVFAFASEFWVRRPTHHHGATGGNRCRRELGWRLKSTSGWQLLVIEYDFHIIDYTSLCSQHTHTHLYIYISTVYTIRYVYIYNHWDTHCVYVYIYTPYIHNIHMYAYFIYHNYIIFKGWFSLLFHHGLKTIRLEHRVPLKSTGHHHGSFWTDNNWGQKHFTFRQNQRSYHETC